MKNVIIKSLEMHYFKGITGKTVEFGEKETVIAAPNGAGKSTIVDAFFWCLWGKNAAGQSDQKFAVKTVDRNGTEIPHVNHEVELILEVDGETQTFKRILVPEYDKDDKLKGNHSEYFWNEVPMKKSEYDAKVNEVVKETVFKLVTSPYAFLQLDWQKQRDTLMRIAGDIKDDDVEGDFEALKNILKSKSLEEYRTEVANKLKRVNDAMQTIPARIDEVQRGIPELDDPEMLDMIQKDAEEKISEVDDLMRSAAISVETLNADRNALAKEIADLKFRQSELLQAAQAKERNEIHASNARYNEAEQHKAAIRQEEASDAANCKARHSFVNARLGNIRERRDIIDRQLTELRARWTSVNGQGFSAEEYLKCPLYGHICQDGSACSQYDQNQGQAFSRFMEDKQKQLDAITCKGQELKAEMEAAMAEISRAEDDIKAIKDGYETRCRERESMFVMCENTQKQYPRRPLISTVKGEDIPEWVELGLEIEEKQSRLDKMVVYEAEGNDQALARRAELIKHLDSIKQKKADIQRAEAAQKRVEELETELRTLGAQKAQLELEKNCCRDFEVAKMNMITGKVNSLFKIVRWQMFAKQVNGEEVPACICLCGGVPWNDTNDAGRLNAGIDVAYTLSKASGISAPMFIDGAEKSLNIYYPGGQRILLKVAAAEEITTK